MQISPSFNSYHTFVRPLAFACMLAGTPPFSQGETAAPASQAQENRVEMLPLVEFHDHSFAEALEFLRQRTGKNIVESAASGDMRVSMRLQNVSLEAVLRAMCAGTKWNVVHIAGRNGSEGIYFLTDRRSVNPNVQDAAGRILPVLRMGVDAKLSDLAEFLNVRLSSNIVLPPGWRDAPIPPLQLKKVNAIDCLNAAIVAGNLPLEIHIIPTEANASGVIQVVTAKNAARVFDAGAGRATRKGAPAAGAVPGLELPGAPAGGAVPGLELPGAPAGVPGLDVTGGGAKNPALKK